MPRGTMLCPEMERHGSGSTVFDSHQLGARWAGDQPQLRGCGYLSHLRIERRQLYQVQPVRNPVRQWPKIERDHWDASKFFQQVGAWTHKAIANCGKGCRADKVEIRCFPIAGRQYVSGSLAFWRKNWGPGKRDFKWWIQNVVPHICQLYRETPSTWCETAGIGRVGWQWNPGSICKCMVGLAGASACSIVPPNPWQSSERWRFRGTKHQFQPLGFQVTLWLGRSGLPAGQRHFPHSAGRSWGLCPWVWTTPQPPYIPNAERPARGSRDRLYFRRISHWNQRTCGPHSGCRRQHPVLAISSQRPGHSRGFHATITTQIASRSPGCGDHGFFRWCRSLRFSKSNGLMEVHWFFFSHIFLLFLLVPSKRMCALRFQSTVLTSMWASTAQMWRTCQTQLSKSLRWAMRPMWSLTISRLKMQGLGQTYLQSISSPTTCSGSRTPEQGSYPRPMGCPFRAVQWRWSVITAILCHWMTSS